MDQNTNYREISQAPLGKKKTYAMINISRNIKGVT